MAYFWADIGNALFFLMSFILPLLMGTDTDDSSDDLTADVVNDDVFGTEGADDLFAETPDLTTFLLAGDDSFNGSTGADTVFGGEGRDVVLLRAGDDVGYGDDGNDRIDGGFGNDLIYGGEGDDILNGAAEDDVVYGDAGNDMITGSGGSDALFGGEGDDVLHGSVLGSTSASDGADALEGGPGEDTLYLSGGDSGTGGEDADHFIVEETIEAGETATVTDFDPAEDSITLRHSAQTDPMTGSDISPVLTSQNYSDGTGSTILSDGVAILNIDGQSDFDPSAITLEPV